MAWTTPRDWVNGELVTHTVMNQQIKDNMAVLSTHTHSGAAGDGSSALTSVDTVTFDHQGSDPSAPSAGHGSIYFKSDGLYFRNTGGVATRLALSSDALTVGQVVEASASLTQSVAGGGSATGDIDLVTATITAGGAGRYYVVTGTLACTSGSGNVTMKLIYDTTVLETVIDGTAGGTTITNGNLFVASQTVSNPATSSKTIKMTSNAGTGTTHTTKGMLSIREIYTS
jgi:hypothetical protein